MNQKREPPARECVNGGSLSNGNTPERVANAVGADSRDQANERTPGTKDRSVTSTRGS